MRPAQPSAPDLPVPSPDFRRRAAEPSSMRVALQSATSPEWPTPSASPLVTRSAKGRRGLGEQPIASQERIVKPTTITRAASFPGSRKRIATEVQLAEESQVSETTAASQDTNDNEVEGDEGDLTDIEADFEETTAMAMRDRVVQSQRLFAWTWMD
jgi:hypothetical protein